MKLVLLAQGCSRIKCMGRNIFFNPTTHKNKMRKNPYHQQKKLNLIPQPIIFYFQILNFRITLLVYKVSDLIVTYMSIKALIV